MFKGRILKNEFASELNHLFDFPDGIYIETLRLKLFINSIDKKIIDDNNTLMTVLEKEETDIHLSMIQQPDIDSSLNYFQNILLSSIFISTYTMLESRLRDICVVCSKYTGKEDYNKFRKSNSNLPDLFVPRKFLTKELNINIDELDTNWESLKPYHELRKALIHGNLDENKLKSINLNISNNIELWNKEFVLDFIDKSYYLLDNLINFINTEYNLVSYE